LLTWVFALNFWVLVFFFFLRTPGLPLYLWRAAARLQQ